jgi:hypothetical protein
MHKVLISEKFNLFIIIVIALYLFFIIYVAVTEGKVEFAHFISIVLLIVLSLYSLILGNEKGEES